MELHRTSKQQTLIVALIYLHYLSQIHEDFGRRCISRRAAGNEIDVPRHLLPQCGNTGFISVVDQQVSLIHTELNLLPVFVILVAIAFVILPKCLKPPRIASFVQMAKPAPSLGCGTFEGKQKKTGTKSVSKVVRLPRVPDAIDD